MTNLEWAKSLDVPQEVKSLIVQKSIFASGATAEAFYAREQIRILKSMSSSEIMEAYSNERRVL